VSLPVPVRVPLIREIAALRIPHYYAEKSGSAASDAKVTVIWGSSSSLVLLHKAGEEKKREPQKAGKLASLPALREGGAHDLSHPHHQ
jgi:hypothetical protein